MQPSFFDQTSWTTIIKAKSVNEAERQAALNSLLGRYRRPILLEIRWRVGCGEAEGEELAHTFIHNCLRRDFLKSIDPEKGRFRAFIKVCISNFLADMHRRSVAQPSQVSLEETNCDGVHLIEPAAETVPPDMASDIYWAREVVALAMQRLKQECTSARRQVLFVSLKPYLSGDPESEGYRVIANQLGIKEGALRTAIHRLRKRLGELIEEEIKQTVGSHEDWRDELRYFLKLLGPGSVA